MMLVSYDVVGVFLYKKRRVIHQKRNFTLCRVLGAHNLQEIDSYIPSKITPQKRGYRRDLLGTEKKALRIRGIVLRTSVVRSGAPLEC